MSGAGEHVPVPVAAAKAIGEEYSKDAVVVMTWSASTASTHSTTWGREPEHRHWSAALAGRFAAVMGAGPPGPYLEDFREALAGPARTLGELRAQRCIGRTGHPCYWVDRDLCSACDDTTEKIRVAFGTTLREHRQRAGLSQERLAARAGLDRSYVGSVERGERNVAIVNVVRLANALDISPAELMLMVGLAGASSPRPRRDVMSERASTRLTEALTRSPAARRCCACWARMPDGDPGGYCPGCMDLLRELHAGGTPLCIYCGLEVMDGTDLGCSLCRWVSAHYDLDGLVYPPPHAIGADARTWIDCRVLLDGHTHRGDWTPPLEPHGTLGSVVAYCGAAAFVAHLQPHDQTVTCPNCPAAGAPVKVVMARVHKLYARLRDGSVTVPTFGVDLRRASAGLLRRLLVDLENADKQDNEARIEAIIVRIRDIERVGGGAGDEVLRLGQRGMP